MARTKIVRRRRTRARGRPPGTTTKTTTMTMGRKMEAGEGLLRMISSVNREYIEARIDELTRELSVWRALFRSTQKGKRHKAGRPPQTEIRPARNGRRRGREAVPANA